MGARARAVEESRRRILDATVDLLRARLRSDVRLEDVASAAGVSVPTVLRAYGSRKALLDRALTSTLDGMATGLRRAAPGDVEGSVAAWFDHYEEYGDVVVRNLAEEGDPAVGPIVAIGRARHREHVARQLGPLRPEMPGALLDALVCVCDVYTWKLLRRDMGRTRAAAEATMAMMIRSLLGGDDDGPMAAADLGRGR